MKDKFLRAKDLERILKVSKHTVYSWIRSGFFIKGSKLGSRVRVWLESDVKAWMNEKMQEAKNHGD